MTGFKSALFRGADKMPMLPVPSSKESPYPEDNNEKETSSRRYSALPFPDYTTKTVSEKVENTCLRFPVSGRRAFRCNSRSSLPSASAKLPALPRVAFPSADHFCFNPSRLRRAEVVSGKPPLLSMHYDFDRILNLLGIRTFFGL